MEKELYAYSFDETDFSSGVFETLEKAIADAQLNADGFDRVFVGRVKNPVNSDFYPDADVITEHMLIQAEDVAGEYAEDYIDVSAEAEKDLTEYLHRMLDNWCRKYCISPSFYEVLEIKEYKLTK